jgi:hypothetical protein
MIVRFAAGRLSESMMRRGQETNRALIIRPAAIRLMDVPGKVPVIEAKGWTPS